MKARKALMVLLALVLAGCASANFGPTPDAMIQTLGPPDDTETWTQGRYTFVKHTWKCAQGEFHQTTWRKDPNMFEKGGYMIDLIEHIHVPCKQETGGTKVAYGPGSARAWGRGFVS